MRLRAKKALITSAEEGRPPKKILPKLGKYIYYGILIYIALYVLSFIIHSLLYAKGDGQIHTESFLIFPGDTGYIEKILKTPGQTVKKNTPVAVIKYKRKNSEQISVEILKLKKEISFQLNKLQQLQNENTDLNKAVLKIDINDKKYISPYTIKKISLQKDLSSVKNKIEQIKHQIKEQVNKEKSLQKLRILESAKNSELKNEDLNRLKSELLFFQHEIKSIEKNYIEIIKYEEEFIKNKYIENNIEIKTIKEKISGLEKNIAQLNKLNSSTYTVQTIKSPINGKIKNIFRSKGENINTEDSIMEIMGNNPETEIRASLKEKYLNFIYPGKIIQIILPDKSKSKGKISAVYSVASIKSKILMDDYKPAKSDVGIKITPFSTKDKALWIKYNKMDVKVEFLK